MVQLGQQVLNSWRVTAWQQLQQLGLPWPCCVGGGHKTIHHDVASLGPRAVQALLDGGVDLKAEQQADGGVKAQQQQQQ